MKKHKIFAIAIGISLAWHLLWMSAIHVVASPVPSRAAMFGKVSFLGPAASRIGMELKLSPRERSFLEKRYLTRLEELYDTSPLPEGSKYAIPDTGLMAEDGITVLIDAAVTGPKLEPDRMMQL